MQAHEGNDLKSVLSQSAISYFYLSRFVIETIFYFFFKGRPYGEPNAPGQGERVSQMDTPRSQPSYSSTYHPSESLIQLRTG